MPIYDYKCLDCGKTIEIFQRTLQEKSVHCPHCGSNQTEKLLTAPGIVRMADSSTKGATCCGREERCETPPCSTGESCRRDR